MPGGKGAWERAANSVDARVNHAAGSTVEGVELGFVFVIPVLNPCWEDTYMTPNGSPFFLL